VEENLLTGRFLLTHILDAPVVIVTSSSHGNVQTCKVEGEQDRDTYQGDNEAVKKLKKVAGYGSSYAQSYLGYMYKKGCVVTRDYKEAEKWCSEAANRGSAVSQGRLGMMYADAQNYVAAHMWFNLAAENGNEKGASYRDSLAKQMTSIQIEHAIRRAKEYTNSMMHIQCVRATLMRE